MVSARGETEFAVLRRLDEVAEQELGYGFGLASLFDALRGSKPVLVHSSSLYTDRLRRLTPADRQEFEKNLRQKLDEIIPGMKSSVVMVDVPRRSLDLGGRIVVVDGEGRPRDAVEMSEILKVQQEKLRKLSERTRIFVSGLAADHQRPVTASGRPDPISRAVADAIEEGLGRSSLR